MPGILCEHCTAACCRYIALPIDTPETRAEFEDIRWFLIHENVSVFVEDGDWYIAFATRCNHLQADNRCAIYPTRPNLCRSYTTDSCDYHSGDYGWEEHLTSPEHLEEYLQRHPVGGNSNRRSRPAAGRSPRVRHKKLHPQRDRRGVPLPAFPFAD